MTSRRKELNIDLSAAGGDSSNAPTSEITYPQDQLEPSDVDDIIGRLHIGTLRREQLQAAREFLNNNEELENGKPDKVNKGSPRSNGVERRDSKISQASTGSGTSDRSGSSGAGFSRQSSVSSQQMSDMGIQTTLGRTSQPPEPTMYDKESGRKSSKKDRSKQGITRSSSNEESRSKRLSLKDKDAELLPNLPMGFICKYMGKRSTKGLWGSKHTRGAIERIIDEIGKMPKNEDLPLVVLEVHYQGLSMRPHRKNKIKSYSAAAIPIQFISYGVQDTVYPRIFCFIMVTEMSSQSKKMEVHAYACDSPKSSRQLAASLALAFETYSHNLDGGAFKFCAQVEPIGGDNNSCEV